MFGIFGVLDRRSDSPLVVNDLALALFLDLHPGESFNKTHPFQRVVRSLTVGQLQRML